MKKTLTVGILVAVVFVGWVVLSKFNSQPPEKVTYHGRIYRLSNFGDNLPQVHLDIIKESQPTGEFVHGIQVYEKGYVQTPTVLYLRLKNGTFKVYGLSGGP